ncbi:Carboxylesterase, type B [Rhizorhabdus wittichii RW1]|uniref:Carboxylic ester hydrolase n=1 Tax=Rhizorhabdus wittichii (strain DSM 6014 / CCUG 31198 / JCM 15750 / NBRC 105917 / EY 4224 / RW1) TaxID=392499 RepID=A0A9J9LFX7_RHIWR|nr:Carboxylesterase, type B [Rhizorhabdus wittichii RW1]
MQRRDFLLASIAGMGWMHGSAYAGRRAAKGDSSPPVVRTGEGLARGARSGGVSLFKGLRYGAPVGGRARFRRAAPPPPWTGIRDFRDFGDLAPQPGKHSPQIGLPAPDAGPWTSFTDPAPEGEDCLRLNIWTPEADPGAARPVLVWLHGGGFREGSGSINASDGQVLAAENGVVVVTLNHRLGVFGYLSLDHLDPAFADSGNVGMLDIVDALRWIRHNIRAFGGDPDRVAIFGESGGGAKVCALMAMPEARGLFHGAITQSGVLVWGMERAQAAEAANALLDKLDIGRDPQRLLDLPAQAILDGVSALGDGWARKFLPVIGGSLPRHPFADGVPAESRDVPMIIGTSRDEATILVGSPPIFALDWDGLRATLAKMFPGDMAALVAGYRQLYPAKSPADVFFAVMSEFLIVRSSAYVANLRAAGASAPTWVYSLEWPTPIMDGKLGVPHGLSVPLAFGTMAQVPSMVPVDAGSTAVSALIRQGWSSFAAGGAPRPSSIAWPPYGAAGREVLAIDAAPSIVRDPRGAERRLLADLPWFDTNGDHRAAPALAKGMW